MFSRIAGLALLATVAFQGAAQPAPATPPAQVPDSIIYEAFLYRVAWIDRLADKLAAQGKQTAIIRSTIRRQAQLTGPEDKALKAIAAEWIAKYQAVKAEATALRTAGAKANSPQVQTLLMRRQEAVTGSINQIHTRFGTARAQVLDAFIRSSSRVTAIPAAAPSSPAQR